MKIYFKAGNDLRELLKPDVDHWTRSIETEPGKTCKEILIDIGINPAFVAFVYTEGKLQKLDYVPKEEQVITLQPPVSGG